jgi:uncharacterized protein YndB with AHSA1/START domain
MTKDKDLKRRVRARMQKTGESYTAARAQLVRRRPPAERPSEQPSDQPADAARTPPQEPEAPPSSPLPVDYEAIAGQSDATLAAKTGRTWPEWVHALDAVGAAGMEHGAIARWVHEQTGLGWWSQSVTVGYERLRGLRDVGQRRGGGYEAGKSRTLPVPAAAVFDAFADDALRRRWLDDELTVRKATPHKSLRITWSDGSNVEVYVTAKGAAKTTVTVQHGKLPSKQAVDDAKRFWAERFDALMRLLDGDAA